MMIRDHNGEPRYFGVYAATVTDNEDPQRLGRVKFRIEGLIEPSSGWAFPAGSTGGGSGQRGSYDVPEKGATVHAYFLAGDADQPHFMGGWHGLGETPTQTPTPGNAAKVKIFETARFLIVLNGVSGSEELLISDKTTGDKVSMSPTQLQIVGTTRVTVIAPLVELGADGLAGAPQLNGVVLGSGVDTLTGATYGALGSASSVVTARKT